MLNQALLLTNKLKINFSEKSIRLIRKKLD